jgi:glycosyltransferase involved in cell wall biosynthesis
VGHTGTLDPFATGVLPVCVGKATRLVRFLAEGAKVYEATVRLGFATTTDDQTGEPLGPPRPVSIDEARLRAALRTNRADVFHVYGWSALRAVALAGGLRFGRLLVTNPPPNTPGTGLPVWDRWLLRHAERVTAFGAAEAEKWRKVGVNDDHLAIIPPGVNVGGDESSSPRDRVTPSPTILCIGPLRRDKGFRDAVWVLDIVRSIHKGVRIVMVGTGPERSAIQRFAQAAGVADRVHLLGARSDLSSLLAEADLLWAPSRAPGGVNAVLEAMAAGKAVIASRLPGMAEIVLDGETGILVPLGDKAALAQQTRRLLDDPDLRRRMGEAGRKRVAGRFAAADMVDKVAALYEPQT